MTDMPITKQKRWGRRLLFLLLLLAILVTATILWLGSVAGTRLEGELAQVRDAGEPITLAELAPPPVPESDNAAALLLEAFELVEEEPEAWYADDRFMAYEDGPFDQGDAWYAELTAWVARNEPALEKAREAAARPTCRFDLDWEQGVAMEFPQIWGLQSLSRVLGARAVLQARAGDVDAAIGSCAELIRLADVAMRDPIMIYMLMRAGLVDFALRRTQLVLERGTVSREALESLLTRLAELVREGELRRMFVGERAFGYSAFDMVRQDPSKIDVWTPFDEDFGIGRGILFRLIPGPMIDLDSAHYLALMRRTIELARRPYRDARTDWATLSTDLTQRPWYGVLSAGASAAFPLIARKWTSHRARVDVARLGLHLALHARVHGSLPTSFADLPGSLATEDPFGDAAYVLKVTAGGGFVVYSVGPDGKDDGGTALDDDERGDLVWRQPASP